MLGTLLMVQTSMLAANLNAEAFRKLDGAQTLSLTVTESTEEFPRPLKTRWHYRKGGFYRYENAQGILIASPVACWSVKPSLKSYKVLPGAQMDWSLVRQLGLSMLGHPSQFPAKSEPKPVTWHGKKALRVELDGTREMTKETKLFVFFDPGTHLPVGISANLGSITQLRFFSELKINPRLPESTFRFTPPKGWKKVAG